MRNAGLWLAMGLALAWAAAGGEEEPYKQGEWVVVKVEKAALKWGSEIVAYVNKGQRMRVMACQGGFCLVPYRAGGGEITDAYIRNTDIEKDTSTVAPQPSERKSPSGSTYHEDDVVVVVGKEAKLMLGKEALGPLAAGTRLTVKKVNESWLGVYAPMNGKETWGWVKSSEVDYPSVREKAPEKGPDKAPDKGGEGK